MNKVPIGFGNQFQNQKTRYWTQKNNFESKYTLASSSHATSTPTSNDKFGKC